MSPSRIALAVACALVAVWLAAAAVSPIGDAAVAGPPPAVPAAPEPPPASTAAAALAADMDRLRERIANAPALRLGTRNPFSLAPPPADRRETRAPLFLSAVCPPAGARPARRPAVRLVGIATDADGSPERTGILSTPGGEVFLVRSGDRVPGGYRVDAVEPAAVVLVDGGGARHRLALQ